MDDSGPRNIFRYNMSFYYQSTIIYFIAFALYLIIRGEFVENSFKLITKDPVLYFFALIVIVSMLALLYNHLRNKYIEISNEGISFVDRFGSKKIKIEDISRIRFSRQRRSVNTKAFRTARIKLNSKIRPVIVRFSDYENQDELLERFEEIKKKIENR